MANHPRNWKTGPACKVGLHPERARLETLRAGGASYDSLAKKFEGVSKDQIFRHWKKCVPAERKAQLIGGPGVKIEELAEKAAESGLGLLDSFGHMRSRLFASFDAACDAGDRTGQGVIAGRLLEVLREIGKLTGEIRQMTPGGVTINNNLAIMSNPRMVELQAAVIKALAPFPEAMAAVVSAFRQLDERRSPKVIEAAARPVPAIECEAVDVAAE